MGAVVQGTWGETPLALNYFSSSPDGFYYNVNGSGFFGPLPWSIDSAQASFADSPPFVAPNLNWGCASPIHRQQSGLALVEEIRAIARWHRDRLGSFHHHQ